LVHRTVAVTFNQTGEQVGIIGPNSQVQVCQLPRLGVVGAFGEPGQYRSIAFDGSGTRLIADGWATLGQDVADATYRMRGPPTYHISLFDMATGALVNSVVPGGWGALALHPDGNLGASSSNGQGLTKVRFMRVGDALRLCNVTLASALNIEGLVFSPNGTSLALFGEEDYFAVEVVELPSLRLKFDAVWRLPPGYRRRLAIPRQCVYSADSRNIFCPLPTGEIVQLDAESGAERQRWMAHDLGFHTLSIRQDRGALLSGGMDGTIKIWDVGLAVERREVRAADPGDAFESMYGLADSSGGNGPAETVEVSHTEVTMRD